MPSVSVPPFERFYAEHRGEILRYLVRALGRDAAEDAFQETFIRALRGYPQLTHGRHLRAWVFTIAERVVADEARRARPRPAGDQLPETPILDGRPPHRELEHLIGELPPTERTAVALRYGYDLAYGDIGAALGSSEEAARQATSSGVRRLRKRRTT